MKKIVISCIFVLNAFQVSASQEGSLLGMVAFCSTIACIRWSQLSLAHNKSLEESTYSDKSSKELTHLDVLMKNTLVCQVLGTVSTAELIKYDHYNQDEEQGPYELVPGQDIASSYTGIPIEFNEELSGSIIMISHRDAIENEISEGYHSI